MMDRITKDAISKLLNIVEPSKYDDFPYKNIENGYVYLYDKELRRKVAEHRYIAKKYINPNITSNDHVHHKDGNPFNNSIDNLEVLPAVMHRKLHSIKRSNICHGTE